jgi:hypothetical protein
MEDNTNRFETLFERAADYVEASYELARLKAVRETSDVVSTWIPHAIVLVFVSTCVLLFNLGVALWLGELLDNIFFGFFIVAGFYLMIALTLHFIFYKWIKKSIRQYFIKQLLN